MANWMVWLILASALVTLELFSGTFYLLMLAVGMLAGAGAAVAGIGPDMQIVLAAVIGVVSTALLHRSRFGLQGRVDSSTDPNVNIDIGQTIHIDAWNMTPALGARPAARVSYRGALWDVELGEDAMNTGPGTAPSGPPRPGSYRIVALRGSRLIVAPGA